MNEKIYPAEAGYEEFKKEIRKLTNIDLEIYKYQIHRRVHTLMKNWGLNGYQEYFDVIKNDQQKRREFLDYITINVTDFFRNPERWQILREKIFPDIKNMGSPTLNILSAGCSYGQEPYSLAILAMECNLSFRILAFDVDDGVLAHAENGIYKAEQLCTMPQNLKNEYFKPYGNDRFEIDNKIKKKVKFKKFNLLTDTLPENQHLILCRNVVIYFSAETKEKLYRYFFNCMSNGGYLMVGTTEQIFRYRQIGFETAGSFLYRKPYSVSDGS